jgi:G3E family GTPase
VAAPRPRRPPIPLTLLTGFLGAGKTTLLNRLLKDPALEKTAVIVNEFGEVGLDHLLVERAEDGIIELSAGCICCTIRGDLVVALENLLRGLDNRRIAEIRRVVIETTGLADPAPILSLLTRHPYLSLRFRLDGIVTLVDAVHAMATLDAHEEAVKQIAVADRIVMTKSDIAGDGAALRRRIARLNPSAPILDAAKGEATTAALVDCGPFDPGRKGEDVRGWLAAEAVEEHAHGDHEHGDHDEDRNRHDAHISAFALVRASAMPMKAIDQFIDQLAFGHASKLIRVKGIIGVSDDPERPVVIQGVQGLFSPPLSLARWPDADRTSRLVVIGRDLDRAAVERLFDGFLGEPRPDTPDRQALTDNPLAIAGFRARR